MPRLSINLLGSFQVLLDDKPVTAFATDKARALLAYLAVEAAHSQRREALAALLWPDQPEERARHNLRQALSLLRQALNDTGAAPAPFLLVERDTVQFNPESDFSLDVAEFTALVEATRRHRHHSPERCLPCVQRFQRLAALHQGDFLAQFFVPDSELFEEWALLKREWLRRLAMEAFAALGDFHERRDEEAQARDYARRQVELEPWREEAHRQLMRLLALDGQRSAALAQYESCRRVLQSEFGAAPAMETTRLFEHIKAEGRGSTGAREQGGRGAGESAPLLLRSSAPHLPIPPSLFVGREAERAELAELLANPDCRLATLTGPGGVGKSRLALQVAEEHRGLFADGVVFVNLAPVTHGDLLTVAIGDALAIPPAPQGDSRWLFQRLRHKELLLVLDNFEHLMDGGVLLSELLRHARGVTLLVTSREKLRLQEEWVYALEGLTYPTTLAEMHAIPQSYSALALFQQRAVQAQRHFALTDALLPDVIHICRLVEGLPLGVELAAAAIAERSCAEIAAALAQTLDTLETTLRNVPPRHCSLRAVFDYSWALLTEGERAHFTALAVFTGGFDAAAAVAVTGVTATALAALLAKSLLRFDGARYTFHELTRQYAAERLATESVRATALRDRHAAFFAAWVQRQEPALAGRDAAALLAALARERGNLHTAWTWAVAQQDSAVIEALLRGLGRFYRLRGPLQEGEALFRTAAARFAALPAAPLALVARLQVEQAQLLSSQAHYDEALVIAQALVAQAQQLADPVMASAGYLLQGQTLQQQGKYEAAQQALEQALSQAGGQIQLEADSLRALGMVASCRGNCETARSCYEQALKLYHDLDDLQGESAVVNNLGIIVLSWGDLAAARAFFTAALRLYQTLGDRRGEAKALNNLANAAADARDYNEAARIYREALQIHYETGNVRAQSVVLSNLGGVYWELGQYAEAREAFKQVLEVYRESDNRQAEGETLANLSLVELCVGHYTTALSLAQQAIAISQATDDPFNLANAYTYLGKTYSALGRWDEAEVAFCRALDARRENPHPGRALELQAERARLRWKKGQAAAALVDIEPLLSALADAAALDGAEEPYLVYWICYEILRVNGDLRAASLLATARQRLLAQADGIPDPELRRSFLENVPTHRRIAEG